MKKTGKVPPIISLIAILLGLFTPHIASASVFGIFPDLFAAENKNGSGETALNASAQTMSLLKAEQTVSAKGSADISIVGGVAIASETGPLGSMKNIESLPSSNHQISTYIVREGDTITSIAKMYGVTVNTIVWANSLSSRTLKKDQVLVILPISGVLHTIKKGDTVKSLAKKYKADETEILEYNNLEDDAVLDVGETITIPDGEMATVIASSNKIANNGNSRLVRGYDGAEYEGYYLRPLDGGRRTQGLHGYNGVDLAAPVGTKVYASAGGTVIVARTGGWNAGYGNYIVISHPNGTQTLYAHLSKVRVYSGQMVERGDTIGNVGSTGKSTGPHLHFEVRGAVNPFARTSF